MTNQSQEQDFMRRRQAQLERQATARSKQPPVDDGGDGPHIPGMITREEHDAKIAASEARMDARFTQIDAKLDRLSDHVLVLAEKIGDVRTDMTALRAEVHSGNRLVITTVIASALAVIAIGLGAQAGLLSAFQTGLTAIQTVKP